MFAKYLGYIFNLGGSKKCGKHDKTSLIAGRNADFKLIHRLSLISNRKL